MPTMKPMDGNIPSYRRNAMIQLPSKSDNKIKEKEIFEGFQGMKKKTTTKNKKRKLGPKKVKSKK